jgi:hypothetical protein
VTVPNRLIAALVLLTVPGLSGCHSVLLSGGPGYDAGTFGGSGVSTGPGAQGDAIKFRRHDKTGVGLGPALQLAGYSGGNDADPIVFTTLDLRYRRPPSASSANGLYWEAGSGFGVAWSAGPRAAVIVTQVEVGRQKRAGDVLLFVGVRERFLTLVGTGSPPLDAHNSVQLVVGVGFGPQSGLQARQR